MSGKTLGTGLVQVMQCRCGGKADRAEAQEGNRETLEMGQQTLEDDGI